MKNILICDDSNFIRIRIKSMLEGISANFAEAANGEEALKVINQRNIDVVILDLLMPVVTGKEVIQQVFSKNQKTKVIVMSADIQETTINFCKERGVFAFLHKPPKAEELVGKVKAALSY